MPIKYSVIIPVHNEERSIQHLYHSLKDVMDKLKENYELIFVNDGSTDDSLKVLRGIDTRPSNLAIVSLDEHRGQSLAMQAGFDVSRGELIITIDGDLQNDPQDIPILISKMKEGYDVVCGWRYERKDPLIKIIISKISSILHRVIFKENIHDPGCTLRVFKKNILREIFLFDGAHRFFTLITVKLGYRMGEVKVSHHPRRFGKSKYNIVNRLGWFIDLIRFLFFDVSELMKREAAMKSKRIKIV